MQYFPDQGNSQNTPFAEKVIRILMLAPLVVAGYYLIQLFNSVFPDIKMFIQNTTYLAISLGAIGIIGYLLWSNWTILTMWYKGLCKKIGALIVDSDPLLFMDEYVAFLEKKRRGLQEKKEALNASKINLKKKMDTLKSDLDGTMKKAAAAAKIKDLDEAGHRASLGSLYKGSYEHYLPLYDTLTKNLDFLDKLDDNWGREIEKTKEQVQVKREEYQDLYQAAKALKEAEAFARGDTKEGKVFQMSISALQTNVSKNMSYIEEFEKRSKDVMKGIDLDKEVDQEEGLKLLEEWQKSGNILLDNTIQDSGTGVENSISSPSNDSTDFSNIVNLK